MRRFILVLAFIMVFASCTGGGSNGNINEPEPVQHIHKRHITLQWQPNSETNLAGYLVFMHEEGQQYDYTNPIWDIVDTECDIYDLDEDMRYYFVVRAYDTEYCESEDSNEAVLEPN